MLLAADLPLSGEAVGRGGEARRRVAAHALHRWQHQGVLAGGFERVEQGGQRRVVDRRGARGAARGVVGFGDDGEDRLAGVVDLASGEDRVVVHDRPAVVGAGEVGGGEHADHAGHRTHRVQVEPGDAGVRLGGQAERGVRGAREFGQIVHVHRLAAHMQVGGFVRVGVASGGGSVRGVGAGAGRVHGGGLRRPVGKDPRRPNRPRPCWRRGRCSRGCWRRLAAG